MVKEIRYTSIRRILDDLHDNEMLADVSLERAVRYTVRFIEKFGFPNLFLDKTDIVDIHQYRGALPCDPISITQVKDCHSGICMRAMTDAFYPDLEHRQDTKFHGELSFKTQGRVLYASFPEGQVEVAYRAMPLDDDGFPMLVENEAYLAALEEYIKKEVYEKKFEQGKLPQGVVEKVEQRYAWLAAQLNSEFVLPNMSEMQVLTNMWNTMILQVRHFDSGFNTLGDREYVRNHR